MESIVNSRENINKETQRKELERLKKKQIKEFVNKINNLLDSKSCGIDFDEFPNEFYFKYNKDWNPKEIFGFEDLTDIFKSNGLSSTVEILKGGFTKRAILRKYYNKIRIVSTNTNDILTVLAISSSIDDAIYQLRQMQNEKRAQKQKEKQQKQQRLTPQYPSYGVTTNYSRSNNWGLPKGWRVKKTAKGKLFFIDDSTKRTVWDDPRPLPSGWRSGKTGQGRKFYINDSTRKTQWEDPRPKIYI